MRILDREYDARVRSDIVTNSLTIKTANISWSSAEEIARRLHNIIVYTHARMYMRTHARAHCWVDSGVLGETVVPPVVGCYVRWTILQIERNWVHGSFTKTCRHFLWASLPVHGGGVGWLRVTTVLTGALYSLASVVCCGTNFDKPGINVHRRWVIDALDGDRRHT